MRMVPQTVMVLLQMTLFAAALVGQEQGSYDIGDTGPAGGLIFFVDQDDAFDWEYLEVAPAGWYGTQADPEFRWGGFETDLSADGSPPGLRHVGTGSANSLAIVEHLGEQGAAAYVCLHAEINGFDDWFLPSVDELALVFENLFLQGHGDFAPGYWSSTEISDIKAASLVFASFYYEHYEYKRSELWVRPIRAF